MFTEPQPCRGIAFLSLYRTQATQVFMPYQLNTTVWKPGDLVIHDAELKRARMVLEVVSVIDAGPERGKYRTRFAFPQFQPEHLRSAIWVHAGMSLHDPLKFGIKLRHLPERESVSQWLRKTVSRMSESLSTLP